ncbi:hypothetical protein R3I94_013972 [Phoxinus phoxinus]
MRQGFAHGPYRNILRSVAQHIVSGPLTELTGMDVEGLPQQQFGIDCGIFIMMEDVTGASDYSTGYESP